MEQPQPLSEPQLPTDLLPDDIQKKKTKNNSANCSHSADSNASIDSHKNKGW